MWNIEVYIIFVTLLFHLNFFVLFCWVKWCMLNAFCSCDTHFFTNRCCCVAVIGAHHIDIDTLDVSLYVCTTREFPFEFVVWLIFPEMDEADSGTYCTYPQVWPGWVCLSGLDKYRNGRPAKVDVTNRSTNWARRSVTSLMWQTLLPLCKASHQKSGELKWECNLMIRACL